MGKQTIREQLLELVDKDYQKFSATLLPNVDHILGVRLPILRKLAKQLAKGDWRIFLATVNKVYMEEFLLQGMVIGYIKVEPEEHLIYVTRFVPEIDNWSVCDSFCSGLKFTNQNKELVWNFLQPYFSSDREFELRFCVVMLLDFYIENEYIGRVLRLLDHIQYDGYYVKMAVAWAVSVCFVKLPEPTLAYLKESKLDVFTYNKALQKITESLVVDNETKERIRSMKRK